MGELYTCKDVAERYGVQIITVWEWIRKKKLGAIKIGKEYRVSAEDMSCVKITATNGTIGALALGDATNCPVKESI